MPYVTLSETDQEGWVIGHKSEWLVEIPQDKIDWIRRIEAESEMVQSYLERVAHNYHVQQIKRSATTPDPSEGDTIRRG